MFALAVLVLALLSLVASFVVDPATGPIDGVLGFLSEYVEIIPNLGWATVLVLMASALAARKRVAWGLALGWTVLILVIMVGALVLPSDSPDPEAGPVAGLEPDLLDLYGPPLFQALVIALLLATRGEFWTRGRGGAYLRAFGTLVAGTTLTVLLAWGLASAFPGTLPAAEWHPLSWAVLQVFSLGVNVTGADLPAPAGPVVFLVGLLSSLTLIAAALVLFRTRRAVDRLDPAEEQALRVLIDRYGGADSLAYFALRRDKSVVFSPDGQAAIAYRVEAGVCLAAGDPLGERASWPAAIAAWREAVRPYGWVLAVVGASHQGAQAYHEAGLEVLELGDEAVIHTARFSTRGEDRVALRRAVAHAEKAGVRVRIRAAGQIAPAELARIGELADSWRDGDTERGFSMALGRWGDPADPECLVVEALLGDGTPGEGAPGAGDPAEGTPGEHVVGLLSFVPWGRAGASLDVMRRSPQAPNGTTELMVVELCRRADEVGLRRISLNFAMFRAVFEEGEQLGAGPILRAWRRVLIFLSRWWQMESLYRSNLKYSPDWVPRYLCFPDAGHLPRIGLAVGIAEGFVAWRGPATAPRSALAEVDSNTPDLDIYAADLVPVGPRYGEQERVRRAKADRLLDGGIDPWPMAEPPTHGAGELAALAPGTPSALAGRLLAVRDFGGVLFAELRDWTGRCQLVLDATSCAPDRLAAFRAAVDLGDLVGVRGVRGASRNGTPSLLVADWRLEAKCLHPLPDKRRGLTDPEALVRQRYLDLAVNDATRRRLAARSAVLTSLRATLGAHGYLEVETPILQTIHGGANARPFRTHINAYDLDLYLRIAPELYLKKLCVGGMDRVFELGRTFRNEGVDFSHNPEFTILEAYAAHGDYRTMMDLTRELIQNAAIAANGACVVPAPDGTMVDISGDWPVKTLHGAISEVLAARGLEGIDHATPVARLHELCDAVGVPYQRGWDAGTVALEMYERLVEEHTQAPTFYCDFPVEVSPLTRSHRSTPGVTERWDLVAWGVELGTAYSELTDPLEQRRRLTAQSEAAAAGDAEAMELDEDFLVALEHGMPPTGGLGMGVDRLVMLITGGSIRETLPFPMVRPR